MATNATQGGPPKRDWAGHPDPSRARLVSCGGDGRGRQLGSRRFRSTLVGFGSTAVKAFELSGVQAMMGHAHITTTMRYVHHRPGADDAAKLSEAFRGSVPPPIPRTGEIEENSAQLSDPEVAG